MGFRTKKALDEQVIVITGASSGIGLTTARMAARRGAAVVMAARSPELEGIASELTRAGLRVEAVVADVSREGDVRRIAARAIERFGGIDTWINNAGSSAYGRAIEVPVSAMRELFETDFWGVVHGSRVAVEHLRENGGTVINVGSVVSDQAMPLQAAYAAAKHAVKGFTDALRMELDHDHIPVQVTLIKPAAIDTPFFAHARNYLPEGAPEAPPPVYAPEAVATTMLECAVKPRREIAIGAATRAQTMLANVAPQLADRMLARGMWEMQIREEPHERRLLGAGQERGDTRAKVMRRSAYAAARTAPLAPSLIAIVGTALVAMGLSRLASRGR